MRSAVRRLYAWCGAPEGRASCGGGPGYLLLLFELLELAVEAGLAAGGCFVGAGALGQREPLHLQLQHLRPRPAACSPRRLLHAQFFDGGDATGIRALVKFSTPMGLDAAAPNQEGMRLSMTHIVTKRERYSSAKSWL